MFGDLQWFNPDQDLDPDGLKSWILAPGRCKKIENKYFDYFMIMLSYPILTVYVYEYFFNHSSLHFLSPPSHCRALSTLSHMYSLNPSFSLYSLFPPSLKCTLSTPLITVLSLILSHCTPWPPLALYSLSPSPPLSLYILSQVLICVLAKC